ncbi:GNAT family N-acetyltransferase [Ferruginibacter sp. HRS2-29]|uniref:GNAT family N-acetyltransferase n=1 Tax=Ferruginibacter sp. HRS2-29 TaxID=2487334 RepID=UPI0020CC2BFC|nr:GNAT family N-acetyltransferase [Ferruginibacter sp. HRS2-29]MCP9750727.1 GNAT family N-acetyltransferase [Ferruginibacter sp. HRS2-29]
MPVEFVPYDQVDRQQWDDCIVHATNGLIYARAFYLDEIAGNWDALVLDDYHAVMPLVRRKKWGIEYLYQPSFVQQLGVFYKENIDPGTLECFMEMAFERFSYADITINYAMADLFLPAGVTVEERTNFILPLMLPYEQLYRQYHPNFTKSLRRLQKLELRYASSDDIENTISLYESLYAEKIESVTGKDITGFKNICKLLLAANNLVIREARSTTDELLAVALLLKDEKRLYNIISCITAAGKKTEANYFLYDKIIEEFAGSGLILDLEGSDIKGVADFYKKFNPLNQPYLHLKQNDLHPVLKLFKK